MNKAEEFFKQNYHTPMDSFLGKYGVPVLHGIHEDGQEEWEDIPIWKVLEAYHESRVNEFAIGFANWVSNLSPSEKLSVWSKNGEHSGLFTMDNEQLLDRYKNVLKKQLLKQ